MMKRRGSFSVVISLVLLAVFCFVSLAGVSFGVREIRPFKDQMEDRMGLDLTGGYYAVYTAEEEATDEEMQQTWAMMRKRADDMGLEEAVVMLEGSQIRVEFAAAEENMSSIISLFEGKGVMVWEDTQGNEVMHAEDFESVQVGMVDNDYVVNFMLTQEGTKRFEQVTTANIGKTLSVMLDGEEISAPYISNTIKGNSAYFSVYYSLQETLALVSKINNGQAPVNMTLSQSGTISAIMGENMLSVLYLAIFGVLAAASVVLVLRYKKSGVVGVLGFGWYFVLLPFVILTIPRVSLTQSGMIGLLGSLFVMIGLVFLVQSFYKRELADSLDAMMAFNNAYRNVLTIVLDILVTTILIGGTMI
ncbi:MAG: hypothetical protein IJN00_03085, partial [Clostridia bacterium]|nr:hypothetical protein [Clostridia bacterium]